MLFYQHCTNGLTEYIQPANMDQNPSSCHTIMACEFVKKIANEHKIETTDNHA